MIDFDAQAARERVVVVDDDDELRQLLVGTLEKHGYEALGAGSAEEAETLLARYPADLVVLDVMLPGEDGLSLCRRLARPDGPLIVMLSALDESTDRIIGLEIGADGYLSKPCEPRELVAHVRAALRRARIQAERSSGHRHVEFAGWRLDLASRALTDPGGVLVGLSNGEFRLLAAFTERPQRVMTRDQLLTASAGDDAEVYDRAVDVQVSRLRRKLGRDGARLIQTLRNEGYIFTAAVARR